MTKRSRRIQSAIPSIPFDYCEIQSLVAGIASNGLLQRFIIWKASEYQTIKQIEDVIISGTNNDLSIRQKELKKRFFDWLVSIESDKFRVLESIRLPICLTNDHNVDEENHGEVEEPGVQKLPEIYK
jgi:hypothetical protein